MFPILFAINDLDGWIDFGLKLLFGAFLVVVLIMFTFGRKED